MKTGRGSVSLNLLNDTRTKAMYETDPAILYAESDRTVNISMQICRTVAVSIFPEPMQIDSAEAGRLDHTSKKNMRMTRIYIQRSVRIYEYSGGTCVFMHTGEVESDL
ncbi:MAG: hypothetical protein ACLVH3_09530 [Blautia obeum]